MRASLQFIIDTPDEKTLISYADTIASLLAESTIVYSHAQALEDEPFNVLWIAKDQPEQPEIEQVRAPTPLAARDQVDAPDRIVLGATRRELEFE